MSYCVNCGVELAASEKRCPLCDTEVINPRRPWTPPDDITFPHDYESIPLSKKSTATFITMLLFIPILVTIICNIVANRTVSWSLYVVGAMSLFFFSTLFPMYFKKFIPIIFLPIDFAVAFGYLALINYLCGGHWLITIGLPLCIAACGFTVLFVALLMNKKVTTLLFRLATMSFSIGIFVVLIELILNEHMGTPFTLNWSYYVLIPCAVVGLAFIFLDSRKDWKEAIRRRMFIN